MTNISTRRKDIENILAILKVYRDRILDIVDLILSKISSKNNIGPINRYLIDSKLKKMRAARSETYFWLGCGCPEFKFNTFLRIYIECFGRSFLNYYEVNKGQIDILYKDWDNDPLPYLKRLFIDIEDELEKIKASF